MTTFFVTGASGFVGRALCRELLRRGNVVRGLCHQNCEGFEGGEFVVGDVMSGSKDIHVALSECSAVVHLAARVHVMCESESDPLEAFRMINVQGTLNIARQAADAGVKRFIFISSIGVNGGETFGEGFSPEDKPAPHTPYAQSKNEAECNLKILSAETGMELVIIRPPLVYGPNAPGNFASLMKWLYRGVYLPLGAVTDNRRSFVFVDNLVDLIIACTVHPAVANQTLLVSDGDEISTVDLLRKIASAMGRSAHLIYVPVGLLTWVAVRIKRPDIIQRLCGSLQIDISKTRMLLGWTPPVTLDEGLQKTVEHWLKFNE